MTIDSPTYTLPLTPLEASAVEFCAGRYAWAAALADLWALESEWYVLYEGTESQWWAVQEAIANEGGLLHCASPELATKVEAFLGRFV